MHNSMKSYHHNFCLLNKQYRLPFFFTAIGFNVETVQYKNIKFQVWDLGGQDSIVKKKKKSQLLSNNVITIYLFACLPEIT